MVAYLSVSSSRSHNRNDFGNDEHRALDLGKYLLDLACCFKGKRGHGCVYLVSRTRMACRTLLYFRWDVVKFEGWKTKVTIPRLFWFDESSVQTFARNLLSLCRRGRRPRIYLRSDDVDWICEGGFGRGGCWNPFVCPGGVHSERESRGYILALVCDSNIQSTGVCVLPPPSGQDIIFSPCRFSFFSLFLASIHSVHLSFLSLPISLFHLLTTPLLLRL